MADAGKNSPEKPNEELNEKKNNFAPETDDGDGKLDLNR